MPPLRLAGFVAGMIVLVVVIGVVVTGVAGPRVVDEVERTFSAASTDEIFIRSLNGRITYETWDGDDIHITAQTRVSALTSGLAEWLGKRVRVGFSTDEARVRAEVKGPSLWFFPGGARVRFHVRVPDAWSGHVDLATSNGGITSRDSAGHATLHTSNGAIFVERHEGALDVRTSNGAVRIEDSVLSGVGRVRTSNGAVVFAAHLAADADYTVRTSNGSVTLALKDPDVSLDVRTSNGRINLHTDVLVSRTEGRRLTGRIGFGVAKLDVRTSNGTIDVSSQ